jgi:hypothetical protein
MMNRYLTIFFLLFMLLIMGAFASMAQNNYGFAMLGWVSLGFTLVFLVQLARKLTGKKAYSISSVAELLGLIVLTFLFSMNNFHIRIPFSDYLATAAAVLLAVVYAGNLRDAIQRPVTKGRSNRAWIIAYYAGVILFLLSFAMTPFLPQWVKLTDGVAFFLLIVFVVGSFLLPGLLKGWENNLALHIINGFRDRSFILACIFFLMAMYGSAVRVGWLPPLYSDAYPKVFFEMTGHKEPGAVNTSRPQVSQNEFKEKYERFVERNLEQNP